MRPDSPPSPPDEEVALSEAADTSTHIYTGEEEEGKKAAVQMHQHTQRANAKISQTKDLHMRSILKLLRSW